MRAVAYFAGLVLALLLAPAVQAQTVYTYVNGTDGNINSGTTCTAPLVRNFSVTNSFTVADVDLGVFATHTWRGDLQITLQAPDGTRVRLVDGDINGTSGDNFNVLLNDSGTQVVNTDSPTGNHSTTNPPPFQHDFIPNSALSAFAGKSSNGTWRLEICDLYPSGDNGIFRHAELYLTSAPSNYSDVSLSKTSSTTLPAPGAAFTYTLTVSNSSSANLSSTGVTVRDVLPTGVIYTGHSGYGTYDSGTGIWTVGTLTPGQSRSLTINVTVTASGGAVITNEAEVWTASATDLDSTAGNGLTTEDDYASRTVTVSGGGIPGTPPVLSCPVGTSLQNWDSLTWNAGTTNNNYNVADIGSINFTVTHTDSGNPTASGTPVRSTSLTGGAATPENNIYFSYNYTTNTAEALITITLPVASPGAQFRIFDVDSGANSWADKITVTGYFNGAAVNPVMTNGASNWVLGNAAYGSGSSASNSADGNITVTFQSPVDQIVIQYGNHSAAPADPNGQVIGLDDITWCKPQTGIAVQKTSLVVSDPVNGTTNPKAIPGATVRYCILITNNATSTLGSVVASDIIPANVTFIPGSMKSGTACASASTAEDDNASGGDENDPIGASYSGGTLQASSSAITAGTSIAVTFDATVN
ncbi:MAG: DUF11 domain-containing protein [Sphingomonadaceae bacterium]|nr:DUF11 domain-containing protein [Sphingomonadaceae bacterium]